MIRQAAVLGIGLVLTVAYLLVDVRTRGSDGNDSARVIGTWELVSTEEHMTDGSKWP
jgi:hypothetical protein